MNPQLPATGGVEKMSRGQHMHAAGDRLDAVHSWALKQATLFRSTRDEFVAGTSVSVDEMTVWHQKGWLSFAPENLAEYDEKERHEVLFMKGLIRSGLSDAMIERLLATLSKPYCYDPVTTFYSFVEDRWINLPPAPDPFDVVLEHMDEYLEALVMDENWDDLRGLHEQIGEILESAEADDE